MKPRSRKRAALYVQRRQLVVALLEQFPDCQIRWDSGCTGQAVDVDERLGRGVGGDFLDPANCQTTCRHCHEQKTTHPAEAVARGFTVQRRAMPDTPPRRQQLPGDVRHLAPILGPVSDPWDYSDPRSDVREEL